MSNTSLSKGGIYYLIYNVLNLAFPFVSGIYVSRVLLPENIGAVTAAQNLVQYFVILSFLGIPTYGLREISKSRNNKEERSKIFSELYVINFLSTIFFCCIYLFIIFSVDAYRKEIHLYLTVGLLIALNAFNISWLYEGMEEFRFISIRNILFKAIAFIFLVLCVRSKDDVIKYALVTVIGTAGNYLLNMVYAPRFVRLGLKELNLRRHMRSIIFLVTVNLAIELYSLVDVTMMNFYCTKESIAFYKYGQAIERMLLQIVNTFTMVLVPRISFYFQEHKIKEFNSLLSKALILILLCSLPMIVGLYYTSNSFLVLLYGQQYIESATILKMLSVLLFISPIGYLLGSRVLLASGQEKRMIIPVGVGAIVNIIGNTIMIPKISGLGAAMSSVLSEIVVMVIYVCLGNRVFTLEKIGQSLYKTLIACVVMGIYLFLISLLHCNEIIMLILQVAGGVCVYGVMLIILKEQVAREYMIKFALKVGRKTI